MKPRVTTESWTAFVGGYYVAAAIFGIGFSLPTLTAIVFPTVFTVYPDDIVYSVEGLVLAAASIFIGIRLLLVGERYLTAAIWYAGVCALLTIAHEVWLLRRVSPSHHTITSVVLTLLSQLGLFALLIYVRSRATPKA
jgi:hypothetical protein